VDDGDFTDDVTVRTNPPSTKTSSAVSAAPSKTSVADAAEPAPMIVKGGKGPAAQKTSAPDAPAPSLIGMASPSDAVPPPNFGTADSSVKPVLQTLNVSQGVSQGLLIKKVAPSYPANALRMRVEGSVEMMATVSKEGNITRIKVLSGDPQLTKAATDAVKQWKYKPYQLNNEPVEITTQVTINFRLPK
jgi:protein TonB